MTEQEQIRAARNFAECWLGRGDEKSETQEFWVTMLNQIFGVEKPFDWIKFERHRIDAIIPRTKVLIEQKSFGIDLDQKYLQSDGENLTPFEQAKRYRDELSPSLRPRWIVTCNFAEFRIYDMFNFDSLFDATPTPQIIKLENLTYDYRRLNFLVDPNDDNVMPEVKISKDAAKIADTIYNDFDATYTNSAVPNYRQFLNTICIRLVFCFYAGDAHFFAKEQFKNYIEKFPDNLRGDALQNLFAVLNQPDHSNISDDDLKNFPYINGGLFEEKITLPAFDAYKDNPISTAFAFNERRNFSWHTINPAIFGAMFESILNTDTRRAGGMHYTSTENIHKVIDPLFLDDLDAELKAALRARKDKALRLIALQDKIASLKFFDPACGSGNFLTETYLSLRKIENDILYALKFKCNFIGKIKVSIHQFFGVEINSFAVAIAKLALWIAEHQMHEKSEIITGAEPKTKLDSINNILCANALQIDWADIVPRDENLYIIGNPPFIGYTYQNAQQKADLLAATGLNFKKMDYVVSWYYKTAKFIQGTNIRCTFVSTNSICQGEQVAAVWKNIFAQNIHFDFAYKTFKWISESDKMAAVHCVIISFSQNYHGQKFIFDGDKKIPAENINAYLIDAPDIFVESRTKPLCNVPEMTTGNRPADGGNLIIEAKDYDYFVLREPAAKKYIKRLIGAEEFINGKERYCLWLVGLSLEEILEMPLVAERVEKCFWNRMKGARDRQKLANTPHLFRENFNPKNFILVPCTSSENRRYIPMGFLDENSITTDATLFVPDATVYHFGVLISGVHMAWTRAVCGRLEMRYRYSKDIVYNNFPWCAPEPIQRAEIERTAQKILDVLAKYPDRTLAKLYGAEMPADLRLAHAENDAAVMAAYGFEKNLSEQEIVAELMARYKTLTTPPILTVDEIFLPAEMTALEVLAIIGRWKYYQFGILTSAAHMAWTRAVCGRLKSDYRYSKDIVYNNYPFPAASVEQRARIELAAEKILQERAKYPEKNLAWLYDSKTMPAELRLAHEENDAAVMAAYGFGADLGEEKIVALLLEKYSQLTNSR